MKASELREMNWEQLAAELENAHQELFNLRFRQATRQLTDANVVKRARRDIARIKTVLREQEISEEYVGYEG